MDRSALITGAVKKSEHPQKKITGNAEKRVANFSTTAKVITVPRPIACYERNRRFSFISDEELILIQGEFFGLDRDGDQEISTDELKSLLISMRIKLVLSDDEILKAINHIDINHDGIVGLDELNAIIERYDSNGVIYKALSQRSKMRKEFEKYDRNNSGLITIDVLTRIISERLGVLISKKYLDKLMKDFDENSDGFIDYEEFFTLMSKSFMQKRIVASSHKASIQELPFDLKMKNMQCKSKTLH